MNLGQIHNLRIRETLNQAQELVESQKKNNIQDNEKSSKNFQDYLSENIKNVNQLQNETDMAAVKISSGKDVHIHETMIALSKAELSLQMLVQVRNRALEAYQEIMRIPV